MALTVHCLIIRYFSPIQALTASTVLLQRIGGFSVRVYFKWIGRSDPRSNHQPPTARCLAVLQTCGLTSRSAVVRCPAVFLTSSPCRNSVAYTVATRGIADVALSISAPLFGRLFKDAVRTAVAN